MSSKKKKRSIIKRLNLIYFIFFAILNPIIPNNWQSDKYLIRMFYGLHPPSIWTDFWTDFNINIRNIFSIPLFIINNQENKGMGGIEPPPPTTNNEGAPEKGDAEKREC